MAASIVSSVVMKILEYLGRSAVEEIAPYFGGRRKLKELSKTMRMIQARLLDAERLREGEDGALVKVWLKRLKHVLLLLEDLFEEVAIADKEKRTKPGGKLNKPLRFLLSGFCPVKVNKKVAKEAKAIMEELKALATDMLCLNFRVHPVDEQRALKVTNCRKTHSYIMEEEVIGREDDKDVIVRMLLESANDAAFHVSIIPIVGIGGLGKTTVAQLVYNDRIIQQHFELKSWACISEFSSLEDLVGKILKSITDDDYQQFSMEQLQSHLREAVNDKKYLLVLDDIWDEDRERWLFLRRLLSGGKRGSKIIVTTRSGVVAQNMGTVDPYELGGLPEEKSWDLFQSLAFREGQEKKNPNLTSIGKEIVKKCANVPLAIRTVASLLYAKDTEDEWKNFRDIELRMIEQNENGIMSTLKLSYDHLPSHLKQCFAYCSLFPKDYEIDKQDLIYLWLAQGFISSPNGNQSLEEVACAYFMELVRRSFFQDVKRNEYDDIISCKMHNLMHDLAQHVAGGETLLLDGPTQHIIDNIWHGSFIVGSSWEAPSWLLGAKRMRSLLFLSDSTILNIDKIFSSLKHLRALDLAKANCECLPNSIGELKLLRYLRLGSHLESLPESITRLHNLQTLDHRRCYKVKELPKGFNKLVKLIHLHTGERLIDLPPGFGQLTSLRTLDVCTIHEKNGLDVLASLNDLTGELKIHCAKRRQNAVSEAMVANLKGKNLTNLFLTWSSLYGEPADEEEDDLVLKCLQPPQSLKRLKVSRWQGVRFPQWGVDEFPSSLPNLVSLSIRSCHKCRQLPAFSRLPHLRFLRLWDLSALEYVEHDSNKTEAGSALAYFPSLETLKLWNLPELKGWSRMEDGHTFSCLSELGIETCPKLVTMPRTPMLESLEAEDINEKLLKHLLFAEESPSSSSLSTLRELYICSVHELVSFSINHFSLKSLIIWECEELINLMAKSPTSLQRLEIARCASLRDISGALQHLSLLQELEIMDCEELDLWGSMDNEVARPDKTDSTRMTRPIPDSRPKTSHLNLTQTRTNPTQPDPTRNCYDSNDDLYSKEFEISPTRNAPDPNPTRHLKYGYPILTRSETDPTHTRPVCQAARSSSCGSCSSFISATWQGVRNLRSLKLGNIPKLDLLQMNLGSDGMLQELALYGLNNLRGLPECIDQLTHLRHLQIVDCAELSTLPESFRNLTTLHKLEIHNCPHLQRRCEPPYGDDWPLIQHIPHVKLI